MKQMSLFDDGSYQQATTPLPLLIAAQYGFSLQHHTLEDDTVVYAVQDWIAGVAQTDEPRKFHDQLKRRAKKAGLELSSSYRQLPYRATNSKTYQMDFASDETLYVITQRMDTNTGIRNDVLAYLAKSGAFVDELRTDPEAAAVKIEAQRRAKSHMANADPQWQAARELGVITRKQFTAMLVTLSPALSLGQATNDVYQGVFGDDATALRKRLGIGAKGNPRDHMSRLALIYTMAAEESCRIELAQYADEDALPASLVRSVIVKVARITGLQVQEIGAALGVDVLTGTPALPAQNKR